MIIIQNYHINRIKAAVGECLLMAQSCHSISELTSIQLIV